MSHKVYLAHHGVKGQRWGVRNGPPYPIESKVMPKGTKLRSVVGYKRVEDMYNIDEHPLFRDKALYTYNPNDEWDSKIYRGPFAYYTAVYKGKQFLADYEFETIKDMKMPTRRERVKEFRNLLDDPKYRKDTLNTLEHCRSSMVAYDIGSTPEVKKKIRSLDIRNLKTKEDYEVAYEIFGHAMEASHANSSTQEYMRRMSSKYDAMVDDNNQGIYNDAHDPVVIFKTHEFLKQTDLDLVKVSEIRENYEYVKTEMEKRGKRVKL